MWESVQFPWEIMGSFIDPLFYIKYLGMRPEWVDMTEILRRMDLGIYDEEKFQEALAWVKAHCKEGHDPNAGQPCTQQTAEG